MNNGAFQSLIGHGTPKRGGEKRGKSALPCSDGPSKDNCKECCTMQCAWCSIRLRLTDDMSTMTCQQRAQSTSRPCSVHRCQYHRNRSGHVHTGWPKKWSLSTRLTVSVSFLQASVLRLRLRWKCNCSCVLSGLGNKSSKFYKNFVSPKIKLR